MNDHIHLPSPSVWPFALAGGLTLVGFGVLSSVALSVLGAALMIWALYGWISEVRHGG